MNSLAHQNTKSLARYLYEVDGRPKGRTLNYWLTAEKQLKENIFREQSHEHKETPVELPTK